MESFKNNGFILSNLLKDTEIDILFDSMIYCLKNYMDYYNILYENNDHKEFLLYNMLKELYNINPELYFNFVKQNGVFSDLYEIKSIFTNNKIQELLNSIGYNKLSVPVTSQLNFYCDFAINQEYRNGKIGLDSHQDWPQTRGSLNHLILWIPLVNITDDNAPLLYVPNSHFDGFLDGDKNSHNIIPKKYSDNQFEKILLSRGEGIAFNCWLVHKTGEFKNNAKIRIAITLRFNDINNEYFISNGYYTAYKTIMNRDINQSRIPYKDEILKNFSNCSIDHYTDLYNKRKFWYNNYGKKIENIHERLLKLHRYIRCDDMSKEIFEQLCVLKYLNQDSKVLELGGNKGRVSLIVATILNDDSKFVTIEPTKDIASINKKNRDINCFNYNIETNILSKTPKYLERNSYDSVANKTHEEVKDNYEKIDNITFEALQNKYNIIFDTLIIDCEGAFYNIMIDFPNILNSIKIIIIENDFDTKYHYEEVLNFFIKNSFELVETESCYPINAKGIHRNYLHQVFLKK